MTSAELTAWPQGKVGFVCVCGRPNTGKSTLINAVVGDRLCAVSPIPQTTRRRRLGILSTENSQIILVDTPGMNKGRTHLADLMLRSTQKAVGDADLILCLIDPTREPGAEDALIAACAASARADVILALNKSDASTPAQRKAAAAFYAEHVRRVAAQMEISALTGDGIAALVTAIRDRLPVQPFFYPPDQLSDSLEREIVADMIREALIDHLHEELPHATEVEVMEWLERPKNVRITADIHVERASQKPIVIGTKGQMLREIRSSAVSRIRDWLDQRIDLRLFVKVSPEWRNNRQFLHNLDYR